MWHANSPVWHPPYQTSVLIRTADGSEYEAELIHLNPQYHQKAESSDVWRVDKHKYINDNDVIMWEEQEHE